MTTTAEANATRDESKRLAQQARDALTAYLTFVAAHAAPSVATGAMVERVGKSVRRFEEAVACSEQSGIRWKALQWDPPIEAKASPAGDVIRVKPIDLVSEQPAPVPTAARPTWETVVEIAEAWRFRLHNAKMSHPAQDAGISLAIADMRERDKVGRAKYGVPLQPHNGRASNVDTYQELLDAVVYAANDAVEMGIEIDKTAPAYAEVMGKLVPVGVIAEGLTPVQIEAADTFWRCLDNVCRARTAIEARTTTAANAS